jgi:sulfur relay (sulfurtransferase) complex TusBCD TusD component (DsrE family)
MCGKKAITFYAKWYKYDNGEQVRMNVCLDCSEVRGEVLLKTGDK